ncbi:MAG: hypothetical protein ACTHWO_05960 [Nesterenkonia sp.]
MFVAQADLEARFTVQMRVTVYARFTSEEQVRLVGIGVDWGRVVSMGESCGQVRMPATEHPVHLGLAAWWMVLQR